MTDRPLIQPTAPSTMEGFEPPSIGTDPNTDTNTGDWQNLANSAPKSINQLGLQNKYDFTYRVFPEDLGANYQGHYVVININVPARYISGGAGAPSGAFAGRAFNVIEPKQVSKVDALRASDFFGGGLGNVGSNSQIFALPRMTRRIVESIALFMPTPMVYNTHNLYEDISLSALAGKLTASGLAAFAAYQRSRIGGVIAGQRAGAAVNGIVTGLLGGIGTASKLAASPINPSIEILFANTLQRAFTFEFLMAPKNARESLAIKEIIKTLRFHAAPEISGLATNWIAPAEFDLTFFYNGIENTNIPRINTCVMERIEVDYAPSGVYSTFSNGHPVAVRLSMQLREIEPIHKQRVMQGF